MILSLVKLADVFGVCIPSRNCPIKENNGIQLYVEKINFFQRQHFPVVQRKEEQIQLLKSCLLYSVKALTEKDVNKGRVDILFLIVVFLE